MWALLMMLAACGSDDGMPPRDGGLGDAGGGGLDASRDAGVMATDSGGGDGGGMPSRCGFEGDVSTLTDLSTNADVRRTDYDFADITGRPGYVLAGWRTSAYVFVESDDVELRDFLIDAPGSTGGYFSIRTDGRGPGRGLRVSNGTIATTDATDDDLNKSITVDVDDVELRDPDISGAQDGITIGSHDVLVEGVCIHDLAGTPMSHNDGIEIYSGGRIVVRDATIDNPFGQTSAINITNDFGPIDDVLIENSTLSGGGYTIYVRGDGGSAPAPVTNIRFRNVTIARPGSYGVISYQDAPGAIVEWDVHDGDGVAIPMP